MLLAAAGCGRLVDFRGATTGNSGAGQPCNSTQECTAGLECITGLCRRAAGQSCVRPEECTSNLCVQQVCAPMSCANGARDSGETNADCGGACPACADGQACAVDNDCLSQSQCAADGVCRPDACADGAVSPSETGRDCGGPCAACSCQSPGLFVHEGAAERCCDGVDNNCNGLLDAGDPQCPSGCADADGDCYYAAACGGSDCDDGSRHTSPGVAENCRDGADNNCDGSVDGGDPQCPSGCPDADGDGYASAACGGSDCVDTDPGVHPQAGEHCRDSRDNNCDGGVDAGDPLCPPGCPDADADGYAALGCGGSDCDDAGAAVHPGNVEQCNNGADDDCDAYIDAQDVTNCPVGCADADGDGFPALTCGGSDCDDSLAAINPNVRESCQDGGDNNCNGLVDYEDAGDCPGVRVAGGLVSGAGGMAGATYTVTGRLGLPLPPVRLSGPTYSVQLSQHVSVSP